MIRLSEQIPDLRDKAWGLNHKVVALARRDALRWAGAGWTNSPSSKPIEPGWNADHILRRAERGSGPIGLAGTARCSFFRNTPVTRHP
jgi:hypothetical protein